MESSSGSPSIFYADASPRQEPGTTLTKLRLHLYTIAAFLIGGILGVVVYRAVGGYLLILAAVVLMVIALDAIRRAKWTLSAPGTIPSDINQ